MGLLSDVWDYVRSKVKSLIASAVTDLKIWARKRISDAIAGIQQVTNYITENITNVVRNVTEYISNVYNYVTEHITNVVNNITKNITNNITNVVKNITNVVGVTRDALENRLADLRGYIDQRLANLDATDYSVWLCTSCYRCQEICPEGVDIRGLMMKQRRREQAPDGCQVAFESVLACGLALEVAQEELDQMRAGWGLKPARLPPPGLARALLRAAEDGG